MNNKPTVAISTDFLTAYAALPRQKQGKVTEFFNKFRNDPMHPGINFEKINEGIDKNICSVRIDDTYRGIVVREPESNVYILLWVDHHDEAYAWAKRKKCSINKLTGSVQIFDVQEVIEEQKAIDEPALFANISDEVFEKIGLPEEQLPMIKAIKTLEGLHSLKAAIPEEAFEGLEWLGNGFSVEEVLDTLYPGDLLQQRLLFGRGQILQQLYKLIQVGKALLLSRERKNFRQLCKNHLKNGESFSIQHSVRLWKKTLMDLREY